MKDEIKEILDSLKFVIDNPTLEDEVGDKQVTIINYTELNAEESKQLLDYITTLQKENEKIKKINLSKHKYASDMEGKYIIEKAKKDEAIEYIDQVLQYDLSTNDKKKIDEDINTLIGILIGSENNER